MQPPAFFNLVLIARCTNGQNCNWVGELWAAPYFNWWNINIIYWKHFHRPQKANVSQERDSLRRGQGHRASRLAGSQVNQAQSPASRVLRLAVPCPGHRIHPAAGGCSCSGLDLVAAWAAAVVLPPARDPPGGALQTVPSRQLGQILHRLNF